MMLLDESADWAFVSLPVESGDRKEPVCWGSGWAKVSSVSWPGSVNVGAIGVE